MASMKTVTIREAKAKLSRLIERACAGEEVVIAQGSRQLARLVAFAKPGGKRRPGSLKGQLRVEPEFFDSLPAEEVGRWE